MMHHTVRTTWASQGDAFFPMFIDGEWMPASGCATFTCTDPYSGEPWGQIPMAEKMDVDRAVLAARRAFDRDGWPQTPPSERAALIRRLAALIETNADALGLA